MGTRWKGFPKPEMSVAKAKQNAIAILPEGAELQYQALQIPQGLIIGVQIQLDTGKCQFLDTGGVKLELTQMEVNTEAIKKATNKLVLTGTETVATFWFVMAGGKSEEESLYGSDSLPPFLFLILTVIDGKISEYDSWVDCSNEEDRIFNIQDIPMKILSLTPRNESVRDKLKAHLAYDKIEKKLAGPSQRKKPAFGLLLIPQNYYLRQNAQCWALVKSKSEYAI